MLVSNIIKTSFLIFLLSFLVSCGRGDVCNDTTYRTKFAVTTPFFPSVSTFPTAPILESLPNIIDAQPLGLSSNLRLEMMSCLDNPPPSKWKLSLVVDGVCDNYNKYSELYALPFIDDLSYVVALFTNRCENGSFDRHMTAMQLYGVDQFTFCIDPVIKSNTSGDIDDRYMISVFAESPVYNGQNNNTYRWNMVAREVFPWIRSNRDLAGFGCSYSNQLEMLSSFDVFPNFQN